ncbi:heavy metal translocating P-type ATPase [Cohnella sp. JJ-181]|uniref:heavy metal translocating P-type ATPase n=1 Tax=Cohnella rhizoplanae TaxID=2974897 RepID=UPI0022FF5121|nr:heavy metal translocating P-type ATPase [Cohnella sp. JJ-181]CAI6015346.1 Zinc-transporting ATPase [Cohnella sp. JJ-181]
MKTDGVNMARRKARTRIGMPTTALEMPRLNGEGFCALACGLLLAAAWSLESGAARSPWTAALYTAAYLVGGWRQAREGVRSLLARYLDVNLLMIAAAIGAACIGYWREGAVLIFIFSLSGTLEAYATDRSRREIGSLLRMKPETALRWTNGAETLVPADTLTIGDTLLVKPGGRIPADGVVTEGASYVNEAAITGESMPVDKKAGDEVFAGTINGQGALFVQVTHPGDSTLFARIVKLVQEAEAEKPASQRFMESFERLYAASVLALSALLAGLLPPLLGWTWSDALYKAMVFLVVASPCALVASIMPAVLSAISAGARRGILFKGGAHLEALGRVRVIAFDKTGTLTTGRPDVTDVIPLRDADALELIGIAAALEQYSEHPFARAVVRHAAGLGIKPGRVTGFVSETGIGVRAGVEGTMWRLGKPDAMSAGGDAPDGRETVRRLEREGKTVVMLTGENGACGLIALRDQVRPEAAATIGRLAAMGVRAAILTGDSRVTAEAVAREAGIEPGLVFAGLLPEDKVRQVKALRDKYGTAAMVGDGVNDAPALAAAAVGIAMGAAGSDAALESADVVLLTDELDRIADAVSLGRRTGRIAKQNVVFALGVILALIGANFATGIALPLGVVGHEGSTILVILNGLRMLRW